MRFLSLEGLVAVVTGLGVIGFLLPSSYWYEIRLVEVVQPAYSDKPVTLIVDRTIKRSFQGEYSVAVRTPEGTPICVGGASLRYNPDAPLPSPVTLDWWVNSPCGLIEAGSYILETTWFVEWSPIDALDKVVTYDTVFTVSDPPEIELQQMQLEEQMEELKIQLEGLKKNE